jgi:type I restriction enzyme S subunit
MSFPRYPAYKPSGVEWLGEVPEHWGILQSRRMFKARREAAREGATMLTASQKYGMISQAEFVEREGRRVVEVIQGKDNLIQVEPDDFVISMRSFQGGLEWCRLSGSTSFHYVPVTPIKHVVPSFFAHLMKSERYISALRATTDLIRDGQEIRYSSFVQVPLPIIPESEQIAIATFLDRETAKIDTLIAEQQRLIELLQEKRQAVISHAVTKGLHPDAPMKDSGVEWLGEVPEHWSVTPLRLAARIESGHTPSRAREDYWIEEECVFPWFTLGDVWQIREGRSDYVYETAERVSQAGLDNSAARLLPANTVILSRTASVGFSGILGVPMATTQDFVNWICGPRILPEFLLYVFRAMSKEFERLKYGSTHNTIYMPDIFGFRTSLPPVDEQRQIVAHLRESLQLQDDSIADLLKCKELLIERRSALISAAVTGQIDVRGLVPEADAA